MSFSEAERALLAALADVLIPAGEGFPSAGDAEVAGTNLDRVLAARPDLADGLPFVLAAASGREPAAAIAELQSERPDLFGVLAELVPGAYFLSDEVRAALRYRGQGPRPIDPAPDYEDLLEPVIRRGPIYRPTPAE